MFMATIVTIVTISAICPRITDVHIESYFLINQKIICKLKYRLAMKRINQWAISKKLIVFQFAIESKI